MSWVKRSLAHGHITWTLDEPEDEPQNIWASVGWENQYCQPILSDRGLRADMHRPESWLHFSVNGY